MSWAPIAWKEFSWEAFATLATGLAAVAGATWVGLRQLRISQRLIETQQVQIDLASIASDREYAMQQQEFRLALFEKRFQILEEFRPIWLEWSASGKLTEQSWGSVRRLLQRARLVFSDALVDDLDAVVSGIRQLLILRERQSVQPTIGAAYESSLERRWAVEDSVSPVLEGLLARMEQETRISEPT